MLRKYPFLKGTLILTMAGIITRVIGFFYRIFLVQVIGEEGLGIYQLLTPVMALSFALSCSGIQTAISKHVAAYHAKCDYKNALRIFATGLLISLSIAALVTTFLFSNSKWLAQRILLEKRCAPLIQFFALSLPFSCLHSCINGYYYGQKKTILPSFTQLLEQITRVFSVYLIYLYAQKHGLQVSFSIAMFGNMIGELAASSISFLAILSHFYTCIPQLRLRHLPSSFTQRLCFTKHALAILKMSLPLTANRLILNGLQSIEAIYIPNKLMTYGMSNKDALSSYGVLTGMALPLLLFPTALTSSVSLLLLPYISEAQATGKSDKIRVAIKKCVTYCILLGSACCVLLLAAGDFLGNTLFHSKLAATYIQMFCITCPTLYVSSVLTSILNGLGKAFRAFCLQAISLCIRLCFVFYGIPRYGMPAYMIGVFTSQLLFTILMLQTLNQYRKTGR